MKILVVGGTFDKEGGRRSGLVQKVIDHILQYTGSVEYRNGGSYDDLTYLIENTVKNYDVVLWWPNVPNDLPKVRDVKSVAPHVLLVSSKRNDNNKYSFQELVNRALGLKSNLFVEFSKQEDSRFHMMMFDPLGCCWYDGDDISKLCYQLVIRLQFLLSITRQATIQSDESNGLVLSWYFDRYKEDMHESSKVIEIPDEQKFVDQVKAYAEVFQSLMEPAKDVTRFLGNASMRPPVPPQVGRCGKGMPSFRKNGYVFVSQRNIDKQFITLDNFVPVYLEDDKVFYCGDRKPSVDTPVQLRLYQELPNIHYMIHSHCYIEDAGFTKHNIPCGGIEEVSELLSTIDRLYGSLSESKYQINLIGHGSIIMSENVEGLADVSYISRPMPERIYTLSSMEVAEDRRNTYMPEFLYG